MRENKLYMTLRSFLELPYSELEELNLEAKSRQLSLTSDYDVEQYYKEILAKENRLKAVTVLFSDIEGKLHMLDYDKKYLLSSYDSLTFDGSSVRGFAKVSESDLRLLIDWRSLRWVPSDVFSGGKVFVFGIVANRDGTIHPSDFRGRLKMYLDELSRTSQYSVNIAVECEGFLFNGQNAEQTFNSRDGFILASLGGYYSSLPNDPLRIFIDRFAEAQRALGFENEKDHPEVAPSQFELNYKHTDALVAADQVMLYKLLARQIAYNMEKTASFLPKPISGVNGSGMHVNLSIWQNDKNLFFDQTTQAMSEFANKFIKNVLFLAEDLCLVLNPSVNAYRRLDPNFEAPNQIKVSANDRTSMIRIPWSTSRSARIEIRSVAPDINPYLAFYCILKAGLESRHEIVEASEHRFLPSNIYDAIQKFEQSTFIGEIIGQETAKKYKDRKVMSANRCPKELGTIVKTEEVIFHHEVTNQYIWSRF
ncbi:MAG: glutamine synthetase family protein [Deltaproteobacteria bacterium]|nr:glutamine synthetase family protein [Deltaproteobacteria bacterium]